MRGTVLFDGKPLEGVIISFKPDLGRPATSVTDAEGKYELIYRYGVSGCKVGPNTISFAWPTGYSGGGPAIPEKYAGKSVLKQEVLARPNSFDFVLESEPPEHSNE